MRTNLGLEERTTGTAPASPRRSVTDLKGSRVPNPENGREQKLGATARSFAILEHVAAARTPVDVIDIIELAQAPEGNRLSAGRLVCHTGISRARARAASG